MLEPPKPPMEPEEPPSLDLAPATPVPPPPVRPSSRPLGEGIADSTIEFDLVARQARKQGAELKQPTPAVTTTPRVDRPRPDERKNTGEARRPLVDSTIVLAAPANDTTPNAKRQPTAVARFPSLVPSPKTSLLQNRWVAGSVLVAVLSVLVFVLARGL